MTIANGKRPYIAYLGPPSSYTYQIALKLYDKENHTLVPRGSIQDVFSAVQSSSVDYGVVPFENSTHGPVIPTQDLLIDRFGENLDVVVCGEAYLSIHHCLIGYATESLPSTNGVSGGSTPTTSDPDPREPRSKPLASLAHIQSIHSHPQALGQCKNFLSTYLKGVGQKEESSTSKAAEIASQDPTRTTAAVSSSLAAEMYDLDVLAKGIEDEANNQTRFFVLRKASSGDNHISEQESNPAVETKRWKTLIAFSVDHQRPKALADAIITLGAHGLNLTGLNCRPSRIVPWHYSWLAEFEGKKEGEGKGQVNEALADFETYTKSHKWLGSWTDGTRRI